MYSASYSATAKGFGGITLQTADQLYEKGKIGLDIHSE